MPINGLKKFLLKFDNKIILNVKGYVFWVET